MTNNMYFVAKYREYSIPLCIAFVKRGVRQGDIISCKRFMAMLEKHIAKTEMGNQKFENK